MTAPEPPDVAAAELARLRAEAEAAEAALRLAEARAALAAAEAAAARAAKDAAVFAEPLAADAPERPVPTADAAEPSVLSVPSADATDAVEPHIVDATAPSAPGPSDTASSTASEPTASASEDGTGEPAAHAPDPTVPTDEAPEAHAPLAADEVSAITRGYTFEHAALELGALINGAPVPDAQVRIPLAMTNRHGLIAGATGTGKTRTLQLLADQLAAHGVPVFAADIKGDLSGIAAPGDLSEKLRERTRGIGQLWQPQSSPTEFLALGGVGRGVPVRATVSGFGPLLLSKVLGLNQTQESSLGLVFHYADAHGLALVDLSDLRAVLTHLTSDEGKAELKSLGGLSAATAGVILRELITFADGGADVFFGEPEFDVRDFLRTAPDGRGIVSLLEVPGVIDRPALFSTFLMYLLAELFETLPEVGDADRPELVFFFDEAHLLFKNASKSFLASIVQTVRLIRSKGVGVFFVTQSPKDLPADVLGQLGSRVQHALRAFTPDDAKALRQAVGTYPKSGYDLERVLQELGTGEAVVTVMSERGAPTPVAWTRLRAPRGLRSPAPDAVVDEMVAASSLLPAYGTPIDRESAREILAAKMDAAVAADAAERAAAAQADADAEYARQQAAILKQAEREERERQKEYERLLKASGGSSRSTRTSRSSSKSPLEEVLNSKTTQTLLNGVIRGILGTGKRR